MLPNKRKVTGNKKSGDELQSELVEYMHDLLQIPLVQRMIYLRVFLATNSYASLTEEAFDEMGTYAGLGSASTFRIPNF